MADIKTVGTASAEVDERDTVKKLEPGAVLVNIDDRVTFEVNYPKDYPEKKKHYTQGQKILIHPVNAEYLEKELKIGKVTSKLQ